VNGPNATVAPTPVRRARDLSWVGPALVIVFAAVLMAGAARLVTQPERVGAVRVVNPVEQSVDVDVKKPGGPWAPLAAVEPQSTTTVFDVVDVGGPWVIRFRVSDKVLAKVHRSHDELEHDHWRIVVPTRAN
jgi:hypothetical protein